MQTNTIDDDQLAGLMMECEVLAIIDDPDTGLRQTVLDGGKSYGELLVITGLGSRHLVVYPCASLDAESGGSIHDHARASK